MGIFITGCNLGIYGDLKMDEIEQGFEAVVEKLSEIKEKEEQFSAEIRSHDSLLLERMAALAAPLVESVGLEMLKRGKQDAKGEIYDSEFYSQRMFVLGKTDPVAFRPDNVDKKVDSQFCVLGSDGKFYELMYTTTEFIIDSYLHPLDVGEILDLYGYEIMFMLYRAFRDYLQDQRELVEALETTLDFIFKNKE